MDDRQLGSYSAVTEEWRTIRPRRRFACTLRTALMKDAERAALAFVTLFAFGIQGRR